MDKSVRILYYTVTFNIDFLWLKGISFKDIGRSHDKVTITKLVERGVASRERYVPVKVMIQLSKVFT